jgi:hypothetical protein
MWSSGSRALDAARSEWRANPRLRWGAFAVVAILWIYGLLLVSDQIGVAQQRLVDMQTENHRLRALARQTDWSSRADEARRQLDALEPMLWTARSRGVAEAALLDLLRDLAARTRLPLRELQLVGVGSSPTATTTGPADARLPAGVRVLRANLVVDYDRLAVLALLAELARSERVVLVERVAMRTVGSAPRVELDVRVLYREKAAGV